MVEKAVPVRAVGMVWYRSEDYSQILAIMEDAHRLPATFEQWRKKATAGESHRQRQGWTVVRAVIDPDAFPGWCRTRGLHVDAKARMRFSAEQAYLAAKKSH